MNEKTTGADIAEPFAPNWIEAPLHYFALKALLTFDSFPYILASFRLDFTEGSLNYSNL